MAAIEAVRPAKYRPDPDMDGVEVTSVEGDGTDPDQLDSACSEELKVTANWQKRLRQPTTTVWV